jgi:hypothetical protein
MPEEREQVMSSLIEYLSTTLNATVERSEGHVVFKGAGFKGHVKLFFLMIPRFAIRSITGTADS